MKHILIIIYFAVLLTGCNAKHLDIFPPLEDPSLMDKKLSVNSMHQDIDALLNGVITRHPAIDEYANIETLKAHAENYKAQITHPMNRTEFYRVIGKLTHRFNDGHSLLIWPYQEYQKLKDEGQKIFPFDVVINKQGEIFIKHTYSDGKGEIIAGTRINQINGMPATRLLENLQQYTSGETRYLREQVVANRFGLTLWAALGFVNDFNLKLSTDGVAKTVSITTQQDWIKQDGSHESDEHYYESLKPGVGMLYIGHFDIDPDEFEEFVDKSFEQIKREGIQHLIVDIRDNPGGNTDTVTYISKHLADKPFRLISSLKEKLNEDNRGLFNYKGNIGDIHTTEWNEWEDPMPDNVRFKGNTYLLISPISYSSSIVFATTLKDNNFATLVGESTGGFANQTAQGNLFNLPNSKLRAYVTTRMLIRPNGNTERTVVTPHFKVTNSVDDIKAQNDAAVDFVIKHIESM